MHTHALTPDLPSFWRLLHRRSRHAQWSAGALLASTLLFLLFLDVLWRHPYEWIWSGVMGALTLHLLVAQWRLAELHCPRCGGSWTEGLWRLPAPLQPFHPRCHLCGFSEDDQTS